MLVIRTRNDKESQSKKHLFELADVGKDFCRELFHDGNELHHTNAPPAADPQDVAPNRSSLDGFFLPRSRGKPGH